MCFTIQNKINMGKGLLLRFSSVFDSFSVLLWKTQWYWVHRWLACTLWPVGRNTCFWACLTAAPAPSALYCEWKFGRGVRVWCFEIFVRGFASARFSWRAHKPNNEDSIHTRARATKPSVRASVLTYLWRQLIVYTKTWLFEHSTAVRDRVVHFPLLLLLLPTVWQLVNFHVLPSWHYASSLSHVAEGIVHLRFFYTHSTPY